MPDAPSYFLPRPPMPTDAATLGAFDRLFDSAAGTGGEIIYNLAAPRWQFICHVADTRPVVLHGSGNSDIAVFEPRQPNDSTVFGNQNAVYAASDGLWPMYFAILDRAGHPMLLVNASFRFTPAGDRTSEPYYFFSITRAALDKRPYHRGMIYFLPRASFVQQPAEVYDGSAVQIPQWASPVPVAPLCRIAVGPEDFPLLDQMRGHEDATVFARIKQNPDGFPWLED